MQSTFKNVWFWVAVGLLIFLLISRCGNGNIGFLGCNKGDTLSHKIDTTINERKDTGQVSFKPKEVHDTLWFPKWYTPKEIHDTLEIADDRPPLPITDTLSEIKRLQAIEREYNRRRYFVSDSLRDKDKKWVAVVRDTTEKNAVIGSGLTVITTCTDTTIKESTTILKHKLILYFGVTGFGSKSDFFHGGLMDLSLKGKNDMQYSFGIGKIRGEKELYYSAGVKFPIRLLGRKK